LDPFKNEMEMLLELNIPLNSILKLINNKLEHKITYSTLKYYVDNDPLLNKLKKPSKNDTTS